MTLGELINGTGLDEYGIYKKVLADLAGKCVVASGSNYVRFGDGTQICLGQIDTSRGRAIQFPIAFASTPAVTFTVGNGSTYSDYTTDFWWYDIRPTYFAFGRKDFDTSTITWIAIGRWK